MLKRPKPARSRRKRGIPPSWTLPMTFTRRTVQIYRGKGRIPDELRANSEKLSLEQRTNKEKAKISEALKRKYPNISNALKKQSMVTFVTL